MIFLILVAAALVWIFIAGMTYPFFLNRIVDRCPWSRHQAPGISSSGNKVYIDDEKYHINSAVLLSLFSPVAVPFILGSKATPKSRESKIEIQRKREIETAEHNLKLAQIQEEHIKVLEGEKV